MNKFTEKTIIKLAVSAPVYRTSRTKTLEYGANGFVEISFHIPVIFPDTTDLFFGLVWRSGIHKYRNYPHLPGYSIGILIGVFLKNSF
jgi:hypothetical protein